MEVKQYQYGGYILAVSLGAIGGGLVAAAITKAIPKIMTRIMAQIGAGECDPAEI